MSATKFKFGRTMNEIIIDDIISDILYNINIEMFKNEVSNEILEKAVYYKKILTNNIYDYETFNIYIKKINIKWSDEILTDKFINLLSEFEKEFIKYKTIKEKEIINFAMEHDAKNLFKSMEKLSFKPKKTIKKPQSKNLISLFSSSCSVE
jgi:hypothetical protein